MLLFQSFIVRFGKPYIKSTVKENPCSFASFTALVDSSAEWARFIQSKSSCKKDCNPILKRFTPIAFQANNCSLVMSSGLASDRKSTRLELQSRPHLVC